MGRKIEIKKIEETMKRQVTFSKRRSSLLKKAEEIAFCCDVDVLFVAFSPSGRLNKFCSPQRVEDMLQRYLRLPVERRFTIEFNYSKSRLDGQRKESSKQFSNYTYTPSFAGSSHLGNMSFSRNPSPFTPLQNQQPNMLVGLQQKSTETFGLSEEQLTFGESSDNSLTKFWQNNCASTRYDSSPLVNMGTQLNSPSQLGLEYDHSNWNINLDNNNNINRIIQSNGQFSIQSDAIASNVNELNFPMEENTMANNEYFAETIHENDAWEWDDVLLNEAFGGDDF
ncbi:MADS-box transcription factor 14-like [Solanum lycopersicum]|uniref:MADS-box transcription factor 14-like n=1 Tax=Solanum lycopersicum TaxID=4081 RepID=UPI00374A9770